MNNKFLLILLSLVGLGQSAVDIYLPSLPHMAASLNTANTLVQQTLTTYLIGFAVSQLFYGSLSDRYGRKIILTIGMSIFIVASLICSMAQTIYVLLIARMLLGIGAGSLSVSSRAIARDVYSGKELSRVMSYFAMGWAIVPILAPLIGSYIQQYLGWRMNFVFLVLLAALVLIMVIYNFPETIREKQSSIHLNAILKNYRTIITNKIFIANISCVMLIYGVFVAWNIASPFLLQTNLGFSPVQFGWAIVFVATGYMTGSYINGKITQRISLNKTMQIGSVGFICSSFALLFLNYHGTTHFLQLLIPVLFAQISTGLIYPNCMTCAFTPFPKISGSASALFGFIAITGGSIVSSIIAKLPETTAIPLSLVLLSLSLPVFLIINLVMRRFEEITT